MREIYGARRNGCGTYCSRMYRFHTCHWKKMHWSVCCQWMICTRGLALYDLASRSDVLFAKWRTRNRIQVSLSQAHPQAWHYGPHDIFLRMCVDHAIDHIATDNSEISTSICQRQRRLRMARKAIWYTRNNPLWCKHNTGSGLWYPFASKKTKSRPDLNFIILSKICTAFPCGDWNGWIYSMGYMQ